MVFFDGVCALCNRTMALLIDEDRERVLHFSPLQGETFGSFREGRTDLPGQLDSIVYVRGLGTEKAVPLAQSDAILAIYGDLGGFWRPLSWARILPRFFRDRVYGWVARNRYKWFGEYETCRLPDPREREQLLP